MRGIKKSKSAKKTAKKSKKLKNSRQNTSISRQIEELDLRSKNSKGYQIVLIGDAQFLIFYSRSFKINFLIELPGQSIEEALDEVVLIEMIWRLCLPHALDNLLADYKDTLGKCIDNPPSFLKWCENANRSSVPKEIFYENWFHVCGSTPLMLACYFCS